MDNNLLKRNEKRRKRTLRVRKQLKGSQDKPRLTVFKSNANLSAQIIDDTKGITLASSGTYSKKYRTEKRSMKSKEMAKEIGLEIGKIARDKNISSVIFDRGRFKFHGVIAEIANGAREAGLEF